MSSITSYKTTAFKESQKFLVIDPSTQSPSLVLGSDLVSYITPMLNYVRADSTRLSAENTDYDVGTLVQTSGATSPGDNFAATYLVVEGGSGDFPMLNGNDLLVIKGDEFLREQLISSDAGEGSDLIAHTGTSDTVTEALDKRTIFVSTVAEIEGLNTSTDKVVILSGSRYGKFYFDSGDLSSLVSLDTEQGFYIAPASDPTGASGAWVRFDYNYATPEMFGAGETSDDTAAFNGVKAVAPKGTVVYCPAALYTITSFDFDADLFFVGRGRRGTKITVTGFATDADTSEKYGIRLIGTVADGLAASPKMWGFEIENTTAELGVNGILVRRKSILEDVYQHGATQDGIHFNTDVANNAAFFSRFTDVWAKDNGRMGCNLQRGANSNVFINCQFDSNGEDGLYQATNGIATNGNIIIGGQASFNGSRGYNFDSGTNTTLKGSYAEFNGQDLTAPNWASATSYTAGDLVTSPSSGLTDAQTSVIYQAASTHTSSGDFETDYDDGLWEPFGTELRVSNSVTYSDIALGLALSNKTHRIRNESTQITTKVSLGGLLINRDDQKFPIIQELNFRDGVVFGQNVLSVTNYMDVNAGGNARTTYREAGAEIFAIEYDGTNANPTNELKFVPIDGGVDGAPPIRMRNNGTLGFFDTTPVVQQTVGPAATDSATTQTLANELRTALINLGLVS